VDSTPSAPLAILLSEEPDEGLLVSTLLRRAGVGVTEVGRVAQVAAVAARRRPEMLVLDLGADVDAAPRACRSLRRVEGLEEVPMLVVSAHNDRAAREALYEAGADAFLGKPVVPWLLEGQVRAALRPHGPSAATRLLEENRAWMSCLVHDMNNPLTIIGGGLGLIAHDPLTDRQRRALLSAREAHERLTRLVASLLDVERVDAGGRVKLRIERMDLDALLENARRILEPMAAVRRVELSLRGTSGLNVTADRELVLRALLNLGENAIRHSPEGTRVHLLATAEACDAPGVRLSVLDAGPGVPEARRESIFDRYVQGDSRGQGAAGLGLAFCRMVAAAHRGRVWAEAAPGGGAAFCLSLPRAGSRA